MEKDVEKMEEIVMEELQSVIEKFKLAHTGSMNCEAMADYGEQFSKAVVTIIELILQARSNGWHSAIDEAVKVVEYFVPITGCALCSEKIANKLSKLKKESGK